MSRKTNEQVIKCKMCHIIKPKSMFSKSKVCIECLNKEMLENQLGIRWLH